MGWLHQYSMHQRVNEIPRQNGAINTVPPGIRGYKSGKGHRTDLAAFSHGQPLSRHHKVSCPHGATKFRT